MTPVNQVLLGVFGYLTGSLGVWYFLRFTAFYQDEMRSGSPFPAFAVVLWPMAAIMMIAFYVCVRISGPLRTVIRAADRVVGRLLAREVHRDEYGVLYRMPSPHGPMRVVKVGDSTGTYWLPVPPDTTRAKEGVAWTYGMSEASYDPKRV